MVQKLRGTFLLLFLFLPALAHAYCSDPPAPGVEWQRCFFEKRELTGADLSGAHIKDSNFRQVKMSGALFTGAEVYRAGFSEADLANTDFSGARLIEADFSHANLSGALFIRSELRGVRLQGVGLRNADLTGAKLDRAALLGADLSGARWLDGHKVCAPNSIGSCR